MARSTAEVELYGGAIVIRRENWGGGLIAVYLGDEMIGWATRWADAREIARASYEDAHQGA